MEEEKLVRRLQEGDQKAFAELLHNYHSRVVSTCYKFLLQSSDAEDIAQEVFIEIYKSIHQFKGQSKISTWIYRITVSKCLNELRIRKRNKFFIKLFSNITWNKLANILKTELRADIEFAKDEGLTKIYTALNRLADNQRVAYTLSKVEGYNHQEISEIMGISKMAVESLIKRAKEKLQLYLKK